MIAKVVAFIPRMPYHFSEALKYFLRGPGASSIVPGSFVAHEYDFTFTRSQSGHRVQFAFYASGHLVLRLLESPTGRLNGVHPEESTAGGTAEEGAPRTAPSVLDGGVKKFYSELFAQGMSGGHTGFIPPDWWLNYGVAEFEDDTGLSQAVIVATVNFIDGMTHELRAVPTRITRQHVAEAVMVLRRVRQSRACLRMFDTVAGPLDRKQLEVASIEIDFNEAFAIAREREFELAVQDHIRRLNTTLQLLQGVAIVVAIGLLAYTIYISH
ncbi:MAG: hypothetical protein HKL79_00325 [Thermoplasmata archaeon]|nr:hypothetical protein [Thermoplasmata archaeon]